MSTTATTTTTARLELTWSAQLRSTGGRKATGYGLYLLQATTARTAYESELYGETYELTCKASELEKRARQLGLTGLMAVLG